MFLFLDINHPDFCFDLLNSINCLNNRLSQVVEILCAGSLNILPHFVALSVVPGTIYFATSETVFKH